MCVFSEDWAPLAGTTRLSALHKSAPAAFAEPITGGLALKMKNNQNFGGIRTLLLIFTKRIVADLESVLIGTEREKSEVEENFYKKGKERNDWIKNGNLEIEWKTKN